MNYIVTNFSYGTGPYLRTTDLAIAFNDEMEKAGFSRMGIVIPWVYGEKQKIVMREEFSGHEKDHPGELLFDAELGAILKSVFYGDCAYEESLKKWVESAREVSEKARQHLSGDLLVETLNGDRTQVKGGDIVVELNRSPRIRYGVAPSYFTSFAYIAQILENASTVEKIAADKNLLQRGAAIADWVEQNQKIHAIAYPATFAYLQQRAPRYRTDVLTPPIAPPPRPYNGAVEPGIFVTITGIPGLERLYRDARRLGIKLYSNNPDAVPASTKALPHIIPHKNILFQFARSGWSSVWISMISGTPLIVPEFDRDDDPEIYFNNLCVEKLGLGIIYRGQPLEEILGERENIIRKSKEMTREIEGRWGTVDGNAYCARMFVRDFLS